MSTVLISDTMDDTSVDRDEHGWFARRTAKVLNVTGGASAIVYNAIQDALLTANNYNFGQAHPTMTALFCAKVSGKAIDTDKVAITCDYRPFTMKYTASSTQLGLLSVGASIQGAQTNLDINGNTITVAAPANYTKPAGSFDPQGGLVNADAANIVLTFTRKEATAPTAAVLGYINTINQYANTINGASYPANTLKLDRINGAPIDNGSGANSYLCTYEFAYNPSTWVTTVTYIDATTNLPALNSSTGAASTANFWNYTKVDFSFLYLW